MRIIPYRLPILLSIYNSYNETQAHAMQTKAQKKVKKILVGNILYINLQEAADKGHTPQ
jgi:hypothetical protein